MWRFAGRSEYLAITGGSIKDVKVARKAWVWPTQKYVRFRVSEVDYAFEVLAISAEKLPFFLSAVFTIGPCVTDRESLLLYAKHFAFRVKPSSHVKKLVKGIIECQVCAVAAASMTMEHVFKEVLEKLQLELKQFGLVLYSASLADAAKGKTVGRVCDGKTNQDAVTIDFETEATIKRIVRPGETKQNAVKTDLDIKIKVEIKEATTGAVKIFTNQATKKEAWSQSSELAKVQPEAQKSTADATSHASRAEYEGVWELAQAQGSYMAVLLKQFGIYYGAMRDYLMVTWRMFR